MEQQILLPLFCSFRETITVDYDTSDGTAEAGSDYTAGSGNHFYPVKQQKRSSCRDQDTTDEENETVTVTLSNPSEVT